MKSSLWTEAILVVLPLSDRMKSLISILRLHAFFVHAQHMQLRKSLVWQSSALSGVSSLQVWWKFLLASPLFTGWIALVTMCLDLPPGQLSSVFYSMILWRFYFAHVVPNCLCRFWFLPPDCNWPKKRRENVEQICVLGYICVSSLILII